MREIANDSRVFVPCGCFRNPSAVPAFQRAFRTMARHEQVKFYRDFMEMAQLELQGNPNPEIGISLPSFRLWVMDEGWRWREEEGELVASGTLRVGGVALNLEHYLLRQSRNKERKGLVLEAAAEGVTPLSVRISCKEEESEYRISEGLERCRRRMIRRALGIEQPAVEQLKTTARFLEVEVESILTSSEIKPD